MSGKMRILFLLPLLGFFLPVATAQNLYFPPKTGNTWSSVTPGSLGWCASEIDSLYDFLGKGDTKAFMVLKDGKIVLEKYFGNFVQDSLWYWASAGKTLTGFAMGLAAQEGYLKLSDSSSKYLGTGWSSLSPEQEAKITVWHHITMTTGLDDAAGDPDCTDPACLKYKADPGTRWAYHNAPYTLCDKILQGATGQNINNFITPRIKNITGLTGLFFPSGYNNVYVSTARSMARFGLLMLNRGTWDTVKIMKDTQYFREMTNSSQSKNLSYGYLTWLNGKSGFMIPGLQIVFSGSLMPDAPADMYCALGKNGQYLNVVPSMGLILVRMGNEPAQGGGLVPTTFNNNIWKYMKRVMCNNNQSPELSVEKPLLFPNPAGDQLWIRTTGTCEKIVIRSISGKAVLSAENVNEVSLQKLPPGVYSTEITVGNITSRQALVIEK